MSPDSQFVCVVGTFDTKGTELEYIAKRLRNVGVNVKTVDLSTSGATHDFTVTVPSSTVAQYHPSGWNVESSNTDRGQAISAMAKAFEHYLSTCDDITGVIGVGGSGGTALVAPGFRSLPVGLPKVLVSTMASGDVGPYVGGSDITMMHSVTDVEGLNAVSLKVLGNAAHALAGMVTNASALINSQLSNLPAIGLTMFGVTTPCIKTVTAELKTEYDCLVFHATGTGGRCMENLIDSGMLIGVLDLTTTEVADMLFGGVLAASEDRFGAVIRTGVPYVGSVGAMDMINFGERSSVPEIFNERLFHIHNDQVTLMRTTAEENRQIGEWVASKLNAMNGPVRFLIPEGGVSLLDVPGGVFHDPDADRVLFDTLEQNVKQTSNRKLIRIPASINDEQFANAAVSQFREVT